ncbi:MAG: hypothetical protein JHC33_01865 [Ignisphaera sp.]|nr:hypothetical protein [Ignisphaera sp.]
MYDNEEIFTITLILDGVDSKLLLSTSETPAKEDEDASGVIYLEDLPEQFNEIVSKIAIFEAAEDGSEESVSHTLSEFLNVYDLDLLELIERGEEILHTELTENNEDEDTIPILEEKYDTSPDPFDIYRQDEILSEEDAFSHIDPREALGNY